MLGAAYSTDTQALYLEHLSQNQQQYFSSVSVFLAWLEYPDGRIKIKF